MRFEIQDFHNRSLPSVQVGEELELRLRVRVFGVREALVDVTGYGDVDQQLIPGDTTVSTLVLTSEVEKRPA